MAKVKPQEAPAPRPMEMLHQTGAFEGDPIVYVRLLSGTTLHPCVVKETKQRQIVVDGRTCEHVETASDGTWIYQMRAH